MCISGFTHSDHHSQTVKEMDHIIPFTWGCGRAGNRFPSIAAFPRWSRMPSLPQGWGTVSSSSCPVCLARAEPQFLHLPPKVLARSGRKAKHCLLLASSAHQAPPRKRWRIGWLLSPYHIIIRLTHQFCLVTHLLAALHCSSRRNQFCSSYLVVL